MSEYTPTTDQVREIWADYPATLPGLPQLGEAALCEAREQAFDRWLAEERWKAILDYEMNRKVSVTVENIDGKAAREWHAEEIRKAKAEALREFARSLDLEDIANEWTVRAPNDDHMDTAHWVAGNAASSIQMIAFIRADQEEGDD